jgi:hypothetical protein
MFETKSKITIKKREMYKNYYVWNYNRFIDTISKQDVMQKLVVFFKQNDNFDND